MKEISIDKLNEETFKLNYWVEGKWKSSREIQLSDVHKFQLIGIFCEEIYKIIGNKKIEIDWKNHHVYHEPDLLLRTVLFHLDPKNKYLK